MHSKHTDNISNYISGGTSKILVYRYSGRKIHYHLKRPVDKAGLDYNDAAKHYYTHSINKILREKHLCENGQKNKYDWYWYHIRVRNVHSTKPAINCIVHLEKWYRIIGYEKDDFKKKKTDIIDYLYNLLCCIIHKNRYKTTTLAIFKNGPNTNYSILGEGFKFS